MILSRSSVLRLGLQAHRSVGRVAARLNAFPKPWLGRDICTHSQDNIVQCTYRFFLLFVLVIFPTMFDGFTVADFIVCQQCCGKSVVLPIY